MIEGQILTELLKNENTELANQIIALINRKNNKITALTRENLELREIIWNYQRTEAEPDWDYYL